SAVRRLNAPLENRRLALSDSDAKGREPVAPTPPPELVEQRDDEPRTAHPKGMAHRDRAPVYVHAPGVEPELANHLERLGRERLVQLDEVEIGDLELRSRERLPHRGDRPDAHDPRVDARDGARDEATERRHPELPGFLLACDDERRRAV